MLRDFVYGADHRLVNEAVSGFEVATPKLIAITRFEVISPDSFMWRLLSGGADGGKVYYLYAEDYVPSLGYILKTFAKYIARDDFKLVCAREPTSFEDSSPVQAASFAKPPAAADDFMRYEVGSGYDHVFLAASPETITDAMFSENAPRGFRS